MRSRNSQALLLSLFLVLGLVLAACGTTAPDNNEEENPPPGQTGSLVVAVTGLPATAAAAVSVSGPAGFSQNLTAGGTLTDLALGVYTVAASPVTTADGTYAASVTGSPATVTSGGTATVTVTYVLETDEEEEEEEEEEETTGSLQVTILGLPGDDDAQVTVSGPPVFGSLLINASRLFEDLEPGEYTVTAAPVSPPYGDYTAVVLPGTVTVTAGELSTVTVTYTADVVEDVDDGDTSIKPAVFVHFNPSGTTPWLFEAPVFNETKLLARGLQFVNQLSAADESDYLMFTMQPADAPTQSLDAELECSGDPVTLRIYDKNDDLVGIPVNCGGSHRFTIPSTSSNDRYLIHLTSTTAGSVDYTLSLNAFCFPDCTYVPWVPED